VPLPTLSFLARGAGTSTFALVGHQCVDDAFGNKFMIISEPPTLLLFAASSP
jgi:hypothetical protein